MEKGLEFDYVSGVSAGAQAAMNYLSGQRKRSIDIIFPEENEKSEVIRKSPSAYLDKLIYDSNVKNAFDFEKFYSSHSECEIVATDIETGKPEYFNIKKMDEKTMLSALKASCCIPIVFPPKEVNGKKYLDGSISDAVPFERAFEKGCDKLIVILAKAPGEECTDYRKFRVILQMMYKKEHPALYECFLNRYDNYVDMRKRLDEYIKKGKIIIFNPERKFVKPFESDNEKILLAYNQGYGDSLKSIDKVVDFFKEENTGECNG